MFKKKAKQYVPQYDIQKKSVVVVAPFSYYRKSKAENTYSDI